MVGNGAPIMGYVRDEDIEIVAVVWNGTMARNGTSSLIGDRPSKPSTDWTPPTRIYNKTGRHKRGAKGGVDNQAEQAETPISTFGDEGE